jgi:protein TonB
MHRQFVQILTAFALLVLACPVILADDPPSLPTPLALARAVKKVNPEYPAAARQLGISGTQDVAITVSEDGDVLDAKVTKGNAMFTSSSLNAVKQWKFTPYVKDGGARMFSTVIQFTYSK